MESVSTVNCYCPECDTNTDHSVLSDPLMLQVMCLNVLGERTMGRIGVEMMECCVCQGKTPSQRQMLDAMADCQRKVISDSLQVELNRLSWHWRSKIVDLLAYIAVTLVLFWFGSIVMVAAGLSQSSIAIVLFVAIGGMLILIAWCLVGMSHMQKSVLRAYANEVK